MALLSYRATPIPSLGFSQAELALGRKLRATLPTLPKMLSPRTVNPATVRARDCAAKERQKRYYDAHHGVHPLPELHPGSPVLLKKDSDKGWSQPAEIIRQVAPRSYLLQTEGGNQLRRNRRHIKPCPGVAEQQPTASSQPTGGQPASTVSVPNSSFSSPPPKPSDAVPDQHPPPAPPSALSAQPASPGPPSPVHRTRCARPVIRPARFQD